MTTGGIDERIADYESQLAALMATPVFMNIQRLRGAIAALRELRKVEEDNATGGADGEGQIGV